MGTTPQDMDIQRVQSAVDSLGEHFDTVQIFCTRHDSGQVGGTITLCLGVGNWYARYGQIANWMIKSDEETRTETRKKLDS